MFTRGNEPVIANLIMLHKFISSCSKHTRIYWEYWIIKCKTATVHLGVIFSHAKLICFYIINQLKTNNDGGCLWIYNWELSVDIDWLHTPPPVMIIRPICLRCQVHLPVIPILSPQRIWKNGLQILFLMHLAFLYITTHCIRISGIAFDDHLSFLLCAEVICANHFYFQW